MEDEAAGYGQEREEGNAEMQRNQAQIEEIKALLKIKKAEVRDKDRIVGEIADQVTMRDSEIDRLQAILNEKDMEVAQLEDRMRQYGIASAQQFQAASGIGSKLYSAYKGDAVDEQLARYINLMQCQVPIKRLGNGYYYFGTRKIFAKIMNGKLVIRVGGGYMVIEEFIANYADQELARCKFVEANQMIENN